MEEGKLPEFSGIIDSGFSPILTHVLEDSSKFGDFKNLPGFLASGHEDPNPLQLDFFKICQFFKFLADPQPFEMDGIRDDFLVLDLEFFHHRSPFQQC